jgi:threonine dehydrogenase-like Zn-dependent dehydrogenase
MCIEDEELPIGLLVLQLAKIAGAVQLIAMDKLPHPLQPAQSFGATAMFQAGEEEESNSPSQAWPRKCVLAGDAPVSPCRI